MIEAGIYVIRNKKSGKAHYAMSLDIHRALPLIRKQLLTGSHPCSPLQKDYNSHGSQAFDVDILELGSKDEIDDKFTRVPKSDYEVKKEPRPRGLTQEQKDLVQESVNESIRKRHSPETRAKMAAKRKAYWDRKFIEERDEIFKKMKEQDK